MQTLAQHIVDTPLGWFQIVGTEESIMRSNWISEEDAVVGTPLSNIAWKKDAEEQIKEYFFEDRFSFNLPFTPEGSDFQKLVWNTINEIPSGEKRSYSELAELLGDPNKARAVGAAAGDNPLLLFIPCHRLIGANGDLTGYAGGLMKKEWLLNHEGALQAQQLRLF